MSVATARATAGDTLGRIAERLPATRLIALAGVALALGAFLSVLHEVLLVTGDPTQLYYVVAAAGAVGSVLARVIRPRTAATVGVGAIVAGLYLYVQSLPGGFSFVVLLAPMADDAVSLLSGLSVLRIVNADVWALGAAPGPVFLASYFGLRRRYVTGAAVAGAALGLLILTGDATTQTTLAGVIGVTVAVAVGDCERRGERIRDADGVVVVLASMVVLTLFVGVVPGAAGSFISTAGVGSQESTMESSLVHAGDSLAVTGPVELSPEVRYTVEADREAYWRVGTYDRYTGGGWVRSGQTRGYSGRLEGPPGDARTIQQRYTAETDIATLPAARRPVSIADVPVPVQVTDGGSFQPASPLQTGESYAAESEVPVAPPQALRAAGTDYPDRIQRRYTRLPESTPERVGERTGRLTANADNPYDTARVLEQWLQNNYEYSLDVERPRGDIADAFLFEMDAGYCTYFATTMVTMLRSEGIPARFAVGYTPGQQVDDDEWVVRGYNSHAWVEVYFPEHGWVEFDPTPSTPRATSEQETLESAREGDQTDRIDTNDTRDSAAETATPTPAEDDPAVPGGIDRAAANGTGSEAPAGIEGVDASDASAPGDGSPLPSVPVPTPEQAGAGLLVLAGAAVGVRRSGVDRRVRRALWLRRLPAGDPEAVVAGAYRRALSLEASTDRAKRPGETPRQYLAGADDRARRIGEIHEQARYGHGVDRADAEEAAALLAALLEERSRLPHRIRGV